MNMILLYLIMIFMTLIDTVLTFNVIFPLAGHDLLVVGGRSAPQVIRVRVYATVKVSTYLRQAPGGYR